MKNRSLSFRVIKIYMKNEIQNKSYIILNIFNIISRCLILFVLYSYIFSLNNGNINGAEYKSSLYSMFIYFCLMTLNLRKIYSVIMDDVKSGNVEMFLNKPVDYLNLSFYKSIGSSIFSFIIISFIGTIIMILSIGVPNINMFIFIPSLIITIILGQYLCLLIYSMVGILSFIMQDVKPIYWIVDKFVMILGGSYLPISMFPYYMKAIAYISPFGAVNFASSTVFSNWNDSYVIKIGIQIGWVIVFSILLRLLFNKIKRRALINGG